MEGAVIVGAIASVILLVVIAIVLLIENRIHLDRGGERYAESNLQLLCRDHHLLKSAREARQRSDA
jgi:hypothetical protein